MDAIGCIETRMSIRQFKPEPVDRALLTEVIATAQRAPSYKNSQPWEVMVVSGEKKKALANHLINLLESGTEPCPDLEAPQSWPAAEQARIDELFRMRKEATGIDLAAPEMILKAKKANFRFYNAPHGIFLYQDASLSAWSIFDLGIFAQTLMLAAHARGLGTVPQAFAVDYAAETKKFLGIPESKRLVLGMAIGYPDMDAPANSIRTGRVPVDEILTWAE